MNVLIVQNALEDSLLRQSAAKTSCLLLNACLKLCALNAAATYTNTITAQYGGEPTSFEDGIPSNSRYSYFRLLTWQRPVCCSTNIARVAPKDATAIR